jgi:hypothetical protein
MRITITVQTEDASGCARSGEIKREDTQEKWFADAYLLPAFMAALAEADRVVANKAKLDALKRDTLARIESLD